MLTSLLSAVALFARAPVHAGAMDRWQPMIQAASHRFGIPSSWIERVMRAESAGFASSRGRPTRSRAGAMGLMQLMPATWMDIRARLALGNDPDDPRDNILAGAFYLRLMYDQFGYPGLFAAYNAGPWRYAQVLSGRRRLPVETIAYVAAVVATPDSVGESWSDDAAAPLFVLRRYGDQLLFAAGVQSPQSSLFAVVSDRP